MVYGEAASRNTHRVFRTRNNGNDRKFVGAGSKEFCEDLAGRFSAGGLFPDASYVVEEHNGKDPR